MHTRQRLGDGNVGCVCGFPSCDSEYLEAHEYSVSRVVEAEHTRLGYGRSALSYPPGGNGGQRAIAPQRR